MKGFNEIFRTIKPANPLLSPHIAYYYFHQTFNSGFRRTFTYYPNYRVALNVFENSKIEWDQHRRMTLPATRQTMSAILTFSNAKNRDVEMIGRINKVGIIFEPLGISYFLRKPLNHVLDATIVPFDDFGGSFEQTMAEVFREKEVEKKRDTLDDFFVEKYRPFENAVLAGVIGQIMQSGAQTTVNDLTREWRIHRKTLLRLFNKHLCSDIRGFLSLVKFRNALTLYTRSAGSLNLTQLAYESAYYDQASFIKHVRAFAGVRPKSLFSELQDMGDGLTLWTVKS